MPKTAPTSTSKEPAKAVRKGAPTRTFPKRDKEIRAAAIKVFCDRGFPAATIQDVADAVGILKGSLYHYVSSKEDLLFQILCDADEQVLQIMADARDLDATPLERLRLWLQMHLEWYLGNLELAKVTFHEWVYLTGDLFDQQKNRRRAYDRFVQDLLRAAQAEGRIDPGVDITLIANYVLGAVNAVPSWYRSEGRDPPKAIAATYTEFTLALLENARPV